MRPTEIELLEDDLAESLGLTPSDLGVAIECDDTESAEGLGLRTLYEHPEWVLGS